LPSSRWSRVLITALLVLPLTLIVVLSAPAWLVWPFLPQSRSEAVLKFLGNLIDWIKAIAGLGEHKPIADSGAVDETSSMMAPSHRRLKQGTSADRSLTVRRLSDGCPIAEPFPRASGAACSV